MKDYNNFKTNKSTAPFINPIAVELVQRQYKSAETAVHMPFHTLGYVLSGSAELMRTDCIYNLRCVYNRTDVTAFIKKQGNDEIELYNSRKDELLHTKKHNIPTNNGTAGIFINDTFPYIKNFKITLNDLEPVLPGQTYKVQYSSPAIPAQKNISYRLSDFSFDFSDKLRNINGAAVKWSCSDPKVALQSDTLRIRGEGVYTILGEYKQHIKKFFIVTKRDEEGRFVLFSFEFKNWYKKDNPFIIRHANKDEIFQNDVVRIVKDGVFKDFTFFYINSQHFAIILNSNTVKHFADYTLHCEMFTNNKDFEEHRGIGFISRLAKADAISSSVEHLIGVYTLANGFFMASQNNKFTDFKSHTCYESDLSQIITREKKDAHANFRIPLNSRWCFYIPKGGDYILTVPKGQTFEYISLTFDTNVALSEFAHKLFFHFKGDSTAFKELLKEKNELGLIAKCFDLLKTINSAKNNATFDNESLSSRTKLVVDNTYWDHIPELSVENIAKQMNFSQSYLCATFKKETGETLQQYIIDFKLHVAKELITVYGVSFQNTAAILGYSGYSAFARAFKNKYGITPKQYTQK